MGRWVLVFAFALALVGFCLLCGYDVYFVYLVLYFAGVDDCCLVVCF